MKSYKRGNAKLPLPLNQELILKWLQEPLISYALTGVRKEEHIPDLIKALSDCENLQSGWHLQNCKFEILEKCKEKNFYSKYYSTYREIEKNNHFVSTKYKVQVHILLLHAFKLNSFAEWTEIITRLRKIDNPSHKIRFLKKNYPNSFLKYPRSSTHEGSLQLYMMRNQVTFKEKLEEEEFEDISKWQKRKKSYSVREIQKKIDVFTHLNRMRTDHLSRKDAEKVLYFKKGLFEAVKNLEY